MLKTMHIVLPQKTEGGKGDKLLNFFGPLFNDLTVIKYITFS